MHKLLFLFFILELIFFTFQRAFEPCRFWSVIFGSKAVNFTVNKCFNFNAFPVTGSQTFSTSFDLKALLSASGSVAGSQKQLVEVPNRSLETSLVAKNEYCKLFLVFKFYKDFLRSIYEISKYWTDIIQNKLLQSQVK